MTKRKNYFTEQQRQFSRSWNFGETIQQIHNFKMLERAERWRNGVQKELLRGLLTLVLYSLLELILIWGFPHFVD